MYRVAETAYSFKLAGNQLLQRYPHLPSQEKKWWVTSASSPVSVQHEWMGKWCWPRVYLYGVVPQKVKRTFHTSRLQTKSMHRRKYSHELKMCHSALRPPLSSSEPVSFSGGAQSQISWRNKHSQPNWILLWSGVINRQEKRLEITFHFSLWD